MAIFIPVTAWPDDAAPESDAPALTLPEAIGLAMEKNRDLVSTARGVSVAQLNIGGAQAEQGIRLIPDSNAGVSKQGDNWQYGLLVSKPTVFGTEFGVGGRYGEDQRIQIDDRQTAAEYGSIDVRLTQPLFRNYGTLINGERIISARQNFRAALRQYEVAKALLVLDVAEQYETILRLERQIGSDGESARRSERLSALTRSRERQGQATELDVLRVDLQQGEAEARLTASRDRLNIARRLFAELLGLSPDTDFSLSPPPRLDIDLPPVQQAVTIGLSNRLEYAQALDDERDARRGVEIARRGLWPEINLQARYSWLDDTVEDTDWFVGVTAGSAYSLGQQRINLAKAKVGSLDAGDAVESTAQVIAREIQQGLVSYQSAQTERAIEERNYQVAQRRAELARRMFEIGKGDHFSVTDAEDQLSAATARYWAAISLASVAGYRMMWVLGTLIEFPEELKSGYTAARSISVFEQDAAEPLWPPTDHHEH